MIKGGGIQRGIVGRSWKTMVACEKRVTKVTQLAERLAPAFAEAKRSKKPARWELQAPRIPSQNYGS